MKWIPEEKIVRYNLFASFTLLLVLAILLFALFYSFEQRYHLKEVQRIEQTLLNKEKELLQQNVNEHIAHLTTRKKQTTAGLRKTLQKRVSNATRMAQHLYDSGVAQGLEREEIASRIREALRPFRFNEKRSYFFIHSLDGIVQLYPPDPTLEGEATKDNTHHMQFFQQMIDVITRTGQGFVEYTWPKPGEDSAIQYKKISFVSSFEPLDYYIGCGEYIVDFEEHIKKQIIEILNKPEWSANTEKELFLLDRHDDNGGEQFATTLVYSNRPDLIGKHIASSFPDAFIKEALQGIREKGETFVTYRFKKPGSDTPQLKMIYLKLMPKWNWIVGQGMYLDDVERLILKETIKEDAKELLRNKLYSLSQIV